LPSIAKFIDKILDLCAFIIVFISYKLEKSQIVIFPSYNPAIITFLSSDTAIDYIYLLFEWIILIKLKKKKKKKKKKIKF